MAEEEEVMFKIVIVSFIGCFVLERLFSGWKLPKVHSWYTRVILINIVQLGVVVLAGYTWEKWLSSVSVFHISNYLNPWGAAFFGYFIATFVFYWWHRLRHENDFFWRYFHQIHHSPQRLEVITSFYKHPQEMMVNSILGSLLVPWNKFESRSLVHFVYGLGRIFLSHKCQNPPVGGIYFPAPRDASNSSSVQSSQE
jgi:sterol desaturase/sphingolipid hydroxylase (fatty acid hydroxylase superfamily)